jgi:GT2 family glycosyltransferase
VRGKSLSVDGRAFYVRGISYGAFRPDADKNEYTDLQMIDRDFAQMRSAGINTVRIPHTTPPEALLDIAQRHGHRVIVGLSAEQYVGYLVDRTQAPDVERLIREKVSSVAGHPALLCYALGNEIRAPLVRWLGPRRIERYLHRLFKTVKAEDPEALVTYVNYPTTEYLSLPFLDFVSFNVYLESSDRLRAYLSRLHNVAGNRPLLLTELGLDSCRHGLERQAGVLDEQIRLAFAEGCCGTIVFSWTDEWYRAGEDVLDWEFGLTDVARRPKPAFEAVRRAYADAPFSLFVPWPTISVVVCTYNGGHTIRECLEGLRRLDYPEYEIIVVDDGSTDETPSIVSAYAEIRLIRTENRGLSAARNTGLSAAQGQIIAYIDDDAYPDADWLRYLAHSFVTDDHAAVGGPNLAPPSDGTIAGCVASSPGGPAHVLIDDRRAEHIPGCNMSFRRDRLQEIGGFDPQFRSAGDDVDVCWRVLDRGWTIGFNPAAVVWHHRRNSVREYWKQQRGYGRAEALLEAKWPQKYNAAGHLAWAGRVYGPAGGALARVLGRTRIYYGASGTAPFQTVCEPDPRLMLALLQMPEWYLILAGVAGLFALGAAWPPLLLAGPVLTFAIGATIIDACVSACVARHDLARTGVRPRPTTIAITAGLHLIQPLARLIGRLQHGLTPWRLRPAGGARLSPAWPRSSAILRRGPWRGPERELAELEAALRCSGAVIRRGGPYDRWDLHVYGGLFGGARAAIAVEDHGPVTQLVRLRTWPTVSVIGLLLLLGFSGLAVAAQRSGAIVATAVLILIATALLIRKAQEVSRASASLVAAAGSPADGQAVTAETMR